MGGLSVTHVVLIIIVLLIFFGPSKLPQLGQSLGKAIRGFKSGISESETEARSVSDDTQQELQHENKSSQAQRSSEPHKNKNNS